MNSYVVFNMLQIYYFQGYCDTLENGAYTDPWNIACGYIYCENGKGEQR